MGPIHKIKTTSFLICLLMQATICFGSAGHGGPNAAKTNGSGAGTCNTINWANWNQFKGFSAVGTILSNGAPIDVLMSANYSFDSTPTIYGYPKYSKYPIPIPNTTVPRTTWAAGPGGSTTMCFSQQVSNPVLLLSSLGSVDTLSKLTFSLPYVVLYDGGSMVYNDNMTITGAEGYAVIMFPGNFNCVTINSSTPEYYTNITWGLMPPTFPISMAGDTTGCNKVTLTAGGGQSYVWDGGATPNQASNTFTASGHYIVTVTRADGCTAYQGENVTVNTNVIPAVSIAADNQVICAGTPVTFTATPLNGGSSPSYQWLVGAGRTGSNSPTFTSSLLADGDTVTCVMTSNADCAVPLNAGSNQIIMKVNPAPVVNAGGDKTIRQGQRTTLDATASGQIATVAWSPATGLNNSASLQPVAGPDVTTRYTLTVTSTNGCISKDSLVVYVTPALVVPNTITPNGDGINDTWVITHIGDYLNVTVDIFDRYGQSVFHSVGYSKPWDGTLDGKRLPAGTYYYLINLNVKPFSTPMCGWVAVLY